MCCRGRQTNALDLQLRLAKSYVRLDLCYTIICGR